LNPRLLFALARGRSFLSFKFSFMMTFAAKSPVLFRAWPFAVAFVAAGVLGVSSLRAAELRAGIAVVDVTPPVPYRMSGYFDERVSTGVKDPLHAKAIVFEQGDERAALVFCDMIGMARRVTSLAREQASLRTKIPADNIVIAATHSHTGPLYFDALRNFLHQRSLRNFGADPYERVDYPQLLVRHLVDALVKAQQALAPVELTAGFARQEGLAFNRRFHMRDGSVRFNPGHLNPDIVRPAGPVDPQVGVLSIRKPGASEPHACLASFALHLDTVGGVEYSADYPKVIEDTLRAAFGEDFQLLFGTGTCGDINHHDVSVEHVLETEEIGNALGNTIVSALRGGDLAPIDEPTLAVRRAVVQVPLQRVSADEIAAARKNMDLVGTTGLPFLDQVRAYKIMSLQGRSGQSETLEVQAFRLGPETAIVTLPGEIFVELGLAIKAGSPFKTTLVIELANDSIGYVPTAKAFAEGSYEVVNSRVESGSGEQLAKAAIALLKELK